MQLSSCYVSRVVVATFLASSALTGVAAYADIESVLISGGFSSPLHVAAPPGDTNRLFVVQRGGLIRILNLDNQTVNGTPFLNVNDGPETNVDTQGEGGLLSIAFHPNYAINGFFFVYYTTDLSGGSNVFGTRVSRFTVSGNPNIANPASETVFLELVQPATNHNGGMIGFKPNDANNYLYVGMGDGGGGCDPSERAQNINEKMGKILRIDVDAGPSGDPANPNAPASNPFVGQAGDDLVWALGLRNPYRWSFDRMTGDMYIGDVGQVTREEISFLSGTSTGGENFGWDAFEGFLNPPPTCGTVAPVLPEMIDPLHDYPRSVGTTVTGGNVYRGLSFATMYGRYFFADFGNGRVWSFIRNGGGITDLQEHTSLVNPSSANVSAFGEDGNGELYFTTFSGQVRQIVDPDSPPVFIDTDQDLLSDDDEINIHGTDPNDMDTDDDGVIDGTEIELGYDPLDGGNFPLLSIARGWLVLGSLAVALLVSAYVIRRRASRG